MLPNVPCSYQMVERARDGSMEKLFSGTKEAGDYGDGAAAAAQ